MQIEYSPDVDILIVKFRSGIPTDSVDISEGVIAHLSEDKKMIEIEILDASKNTEIDEVLLKGMAASKL